MNVFKNLLTTVITILIYGTVWNSALSIKKCDTDYNLAKFDEEEGTIRFSVIDD